MINRRKKSLRNRLILSGMVSVVIPFFIIGIVIYIQVSTFMLELFNEKSAHFADDISTVIKTELKQELMLASSIAANDHIVSAAKSGNYNIAETELKNIFNSIGRKHFTIFLADKNGVVKADALFKHEPEINLSERAYFIKARKGRTNITGPIRSIAPDSYGKPLIIISVPIQENNVFYGMVGIPLTTDFITEIISEKRQGKTGYAFLLDSKGIVLAHPRTEFILNLPLLDQEGTGQLKKLVAAKQNGTAVYSFEGKEKIAGLSTIELTGWIAVFTQEKSEIMAPVYRIVFFIFLSGILYLIITITIFSLFSGKISTPIQKMMEMRKQVTRHSTEIILQIGLDKKITFANPAFERITGIKAEAAIGAQPAWDNSRNIPAEEIWKMLESGKSWSGRITLKSNKPNPAQLDVMLIPLRDDQGTIHGYLQIGRDVTAELMYEKRLQQSQKLESIGTLAGGIAHDFNNILSAIFGYAELSLMNKDSVETTEKYIRQIIKASERARDLIGQILTFSRETDIELRPLFPKTTLKEALTLLRASIPSRIDIRQKLTSDSAIMAEPTQMHQVVMNLVTNAASAIGDSTGTINVELEDFIVDEHFTNTHPNIQKGKHIQLRITDSGAGIKKEDIDHIFEPFFTTKTHGKGTGLGLSVVHGIVKKFGGIITVYSEVGEGTTFNVFVPCTKDGRSKSEENNAVERGTENIALIDDDKSIVTALKSLLENYGYTVTIFTNGKDALREIKTTEKDFDVIITDYSMPGMTGIELAAALKEAGIDTPVILASGFLEKHIEAEVKRIGIAEMIAKPINAYQITDAIRRVVNDQSGR